MLSIVSPGKRCSVSMDFRDLSNSSAEILRDVSAHTKDMTLMSGRVIAIQLKRLAQVSFSVENGGMIKQVEQ